MQDSLSLEHSATRSLTTAKAFPIKPSERGLIVGRTGSGKSVLARNLLQQWPHVVIIDPKGDFSLPGERVCQSPYELHRGKARSERPIRYKPKPEYWDFETYDAVFRWIYERENCTVYVDEIFAVMSEGGRSPFWLKAILTRGRSLNIRAVCATQRPFSVPLALLSESEHYFCFDLAMPDDLKRMASLMGSEVFEPLATEHSFWYYNIKRPGQGCRQYELNIRR